MNVEIKSLLKPVIAVLLLLGICLAGLHAAAAITLLTSYTKLLAEDYPAARYSAMLSQQLSQMSPTVTIGLRKAIDNQAALAVAAEHPINGHYSALIMKSLLDGKYSIPSEVSIEEILRAVRRSNMRRDIGAASIIHQELRSRSILMSGSDLIELEGEVAYDQFVSFIFTAGRVTEQSAEEKLAPILAPLREAYEKSQNKLCSISSYRCEINKIRWLIAECNYQRDVLGSANDGCFDSVRNAYLMSFGHPVQSDVSFQKCTSRFGAHGCSRIVYELPHYMESLVVGYGHSKGD